MAEESSSSDGSEMEAEVEAVEAEEPPRPLRGKRYRAPNGNYSDYYTKRLKPAPDPVDPRLTLLRAEWFAGKKCLDVGCNDGRLTLAILREFRPAVMLGIDCDAALVRSAISNAAEWRKKTVAAPLDPLQPPATVTSLVPRGVRRQTGRPGASSSAGAPAATSGAPPAGAASQQANGAAVTSETLLESVSGPAARREAIAARRSLPRVAFLQEDFVLQRHSDHSYDVITCFSVTKWVHLNHKDEGLLHLFRKLRGLLRPGGVLLLEAQPWERYRRRRRCSKEAQANYGQLKLRPEQFPELLVREAGFAAVHDLGVPEGSEAGFQRRVLLCTTAAGSRSHK